jgi:hypothetical protein
MINATIKDKISIREMVLKPCHTILCFAAPVDFSMQIRFVSSKLSESKILMVLIIANNNTTLPIESKRKRSFLLVCSKVPDSLIPVVEYISEKGCKTISGFSLAHFST